ncbi:Zinc finger C2H2-type [Cinara cedri]|uniref:Zinc finger C2H2-type n=1 Tax=Cinara cedri TaxID=506608 RepID=A0A5E4MW40_9HEMI|nr:Zinc finger C2H2-type [Cinara cedri]
MQNGKVIKHIDKLDYNNPILISSCMESQILKKNRFAELKCEIDVINDTHFFSSSIIIENNDLEFVYNVQTEYGNKPYICSICKKWFGRLSTFLSHMKVHNTSRKSINRCSLCGCLTFFSSKELTKKNNKAIISNKTPFKCRICQIIF